MDFQTQILIIVFSSIFVVLMFQLSSYLNMTILSTGVSVIEIEEFSALSGIDESRIRMIPIIGHKVKFNILSEDLKQIIGYVLFDLELIKIIYSENIEISHKNFLELKKNKFANIIKIPKEQIKISDDGNTYYQIELDSNGHEKIIGTITFLDDNSISEVNGTFTKYV